MSEEAKAIQESAKAVQEVAKASGKAIEASEGFGRWLDRVFGEPVAESVGRLWTDRVRASRVAAAIYNWERLTILLDNVDKKLRKRGICTTRVVPPKIALPLLEHATMENEDELHEMWENLMAAGLDPTAEQIRRSYVSVLSEMTGRDVRSLRAAYAEWWYYQDRDVPPMMRKDQNRYTSGVGIDNEASAVLFHRLGLVLPVHIQVEEYRNRRVVASSWRLPDGEFEVEGGEQATVLGDLSVVGFTEFGENFSKAVIGDVKGMYTPPDFKSWPPLKF